MIFEDLFLGDFNFYYNLCKWLVVIMYSCFVNVLNIFFYNYSVFMK